MNRPDSRKFSLDDDFDPASSASELVPWDKSLKSLTSDVQETCPKIIELDLSRNLFEELIEVVDICRQLSGLRTLRLDGNRFKGFSMPPMMLPVLHRTPFNCLTSLSLDDTLIEWHNVSRPDVLKRTASTKLTQICN